MIDFTLHSNHIPVALCHMSCLEQAGLIDLYDESRLENYQAICADRFNEPKPVLNFPFFIYEPAWVSRVLGTLIEIPGMYRRYPREWACYLENGYCLEGEKVTQEVVRGFLTEMVVRVFAKVKLCTFGPSFRGINWRSTWSGHGELTLSSSGASSLK